MSLKRFSRTCPHKNKKHQKLQNANNTHEARDVAHIIYHDNMAHSLTSHQHMCTIQDSRVLPNCPTTLKTSSTFSKSHQGRMSTTHCRPDDAAIFSYSLRTVSCINDKSINLFKKVTPPGSTKQYARFFARGHNLKKN